MTALCIPEHRSWTTAYARDRFRDPSGMQSLARMLTDGEEELARFVNTLRTAGRLVETVAAPTYSPGAAWWALCRGGASSPSDTADAGRSSGNVSARKPEPLRDVESWDCRAVRRWLQEEFALGETSLARFDEHRVDGRTLLLIDDTDLSGELGMGSRLLRKRVLDGVARRREWPGVVKEAL